MTELAMPEGQSSQPGESAGSRRQQGFDWPRQPGEPAYANQTDAAVPFRRRYFFFDYDGTLVMFGSKQMPDSTRYALEELRCRGHFVALATGRLQCNAVDYIAPLGITNVVADGGHSVTIEGELVWMEPLELDMARDCLRRLNAQGFEWAVQTKNELVRQSPFANFGQKAGDYYVQTQHVSGLVPEQLDCIHKIYILANDAEFCALLESGILEDVPWMRYNNRTVYVEPTDKQRGIKMVLDHFGAAYEDAVVFGDGRNDLSMFLPEWTCIAMGNADPELKACADFVTANVEDDGVMRACQHFGWID